MKTLRIQILILSIFVLASNVLAQATQNIFYLHGWTQANTAMQPVAVDMQGRFGWPTMGTLSGYNSGVVPPTPIGIGWESMFNVYPALRNAHPEGQYIGVGYSAGGLVERSIVYHTTTLQMPANFITGLVTVNTPNQGSLMSDPWHRAAFIHEWYVAQVNIWRGEASFIAQLVGGLFYPIIMAPAQFASLIDQAWNGFLRDMDPSSTFLTNLNTFTGHEQALMGGRALVWSEMTSPRYPAYSDYANGQQLWVQKREEARNNSHWHDQEADRHKRRPWYQFWKWFQVWWHRTRAGDWNACRQGFDDMNDTWEHHTANRQNSDAFISVASQQGIPGVGADRRFQAAGTLHPGLLTHGEVINNAHGPAMTAIEQAMRRVGAR